MQYGYSYDGENFTGRLATIALALDDALLPNHDAHHVVHICECHQPAAESYVDADFVLDHIAEQDEYSIEHAEGWPNASPEQRQELTDALQRVIGEWLDRHKLRDSFYLARNVRRFELIAGSWVEITEDL